MAFPQHHHDCIDCTHLGTSYQVIPAMLGPFHSMVSRGDFYRCHRPLDVVYVCKRSEDDVVEESRAVLADRSYVALARSTKSYGFHKDALKVISLLDGMDKLGDGYAVVSLADDPGNPHVVTSPLLLPHEGEILTRVAIVVVNQIKQPGVMKRDPGLVRKKIHDKLLAASNENGYLTRWNKGALFSPPQSTSPDDNAGAVT
jgi:hypothetical protein